MRIATSSAKGEKTAISIRVLCGTKTIGSNKILMGFDRKSILLDFGMDFSVTKRYFDSFLNPRGAPLLSSACLAIDATLRKLFIEALV